MLFFSKATRAVLPDKHGEMLQAWMFWPFWAAVQVFWKVAHAWVIPNNSEIFLSHALWSCLHINDLWLEVWSFHRTRVEVRCHDLEKTWRRHPTPQNHFSRHAILTGLVLLVQTLGDLNIYITIYPSQSKWEIKLDHSQEKIHTLIWRTGDLLILPNDSPWGIGVPSDRLPPKFDAWEIYMGTYLIFPINGLHFPSKTTITGDWYPLRHRHCARPGLRLGWSLPRLSATACGDTGRVGAAQLAVGELMKHHSKRGFGGAETSWHSILFVDRCW